VAVFGNLNLGEIVILGLLGFFIFGPERLPKVAADAARVVRQLRDMARGATEELRSELGPDVEALHLAELRDLKDLHPRNFARSVLADDEPAVHAPTGAVASSPTPSFATWRPLERGEQPPFDREAT
jgi:sec-independent protein translocase protein TatB